MKKPRVKQLTPVELEIMKVLWQTGPVTVQTVREKLPGLPRPAYTTVQTMLNVLLRKGKVTRVLKGQAYEYAPAVSKQAAVGQAVRDLLNRLFGGSSEALVMNLIQNRQLTREKLTRLTKMVEQSQNAKEQGHDDN
ncbi:MAG TPA: BlaI/MecI/CopY family transcriptional regulator [Candidatus Angelobacter sp.]|nr:BlaI/MecI/CopY family transcriptional regulator [Candidatus Angelobacter sp.]